MECREQSAVRTGLATICAFGIGIVSLLVGIATFVVAVSGGFSTPSIPLFERVESLVLMTAATIAALSGIALALSILRATRRAYLFLGMWIGAGLLCLAVLAKDGSVGLPAIASTLGFGSGFTRGAFAELRARERD